MTHHHDHALLGTQTMCTALLRCRPRSTLCHIHHEIHPIPLSQRCMMQINTSNRNPRQATNGLLLPADLSFHVLVVCSN
jgi:hypothetical protein